MESKIEILALLLVIFMGLWRVYQFGVRWRKIHPKPQPAQNEKEKTKKIEEEKKDVIIPLPEFNWRKTEPIKFRPFKPKYHLTMGLQNSTASELIEMDKNYMSRITLRKSIIASHRETVLGATPRSVTAVNELYTYLTSKYLPQRYPTMFSLSPDSKNLSNLVTSTDLPLSPSTDPLITLQRLGENIDEDFLLLLPSEKPGQGYILDAFVTCFPSGFDTSEKWGKSLRDIHGPVPGYKEKLEKSMDRFFERMEVGRLVMRVNWAITTHDRLFAASGNHLYEGEEAAVEEVDISKTYLRCERQILHRLPESRALCFSFKTYLYPIADIKREGLGEDLAVAIDGLKEGSTPAMHFYKKGVVWGEAVKAFLRGKDEEDEI